MLREDLHLGSHYVEGVLRGGMKTDMTSLLRITYDYHHMLVTAGAIMDDKWVIRATAPILKRWKGKRMREMEMWVVGEGGKVEVVDRYND